MLNDNHISPENYGAWTIHESEHCGVRIDGPNGRAVLHVIQRDPHPALGQGITQAEAQAVAERIVALWNTSLTAVSICALIDRLDGYLNSPEQIALRDELLAHVSGVLGMDHQSFSHDTPMVSREGGK